VLLLCRVPTLLCCVLLLRDWCAVPHMLLLQLVLLCQLNHTLP
jgi:hypothetical protein